MESGAGDSCSKKNLRIRPFRAILDMTYDVGDSLLCFAAVGASLAAHQGGALLFFMRRMCPGMGGRRVWDPGWNRLTDAPE